MATIFMDGFDYYASADFPSRWTSGTATLGATLARLPSGQGCTVNTSAVKSFGVNYVQGVLGFAFKATSGSLASRTIAPIFDGGSEQISIRTNASSVLVVNRGSTLLGTGTTVLSSATWYYIELKFSISASAGTVLLHLNGVNEALTYVTGTSTTQNTKSTANVQWNGIQMLATGGFTYNIDDVYVLDTSTGTNTDFLGPVRVVALLPAAAGNKAQWTANGGSNFGCVSEMFEDGDGSFNQSNTANQIDSFEMQDLPASSGSVYAVQQVTVARQDSGTARTLAPLFRIGGTDYPGTTVSLSTSYQFLAQIYDLQPVGGTPAWDVSTVNGAESGYKLIS